MGMKMAGRIGRTETNEVKFDRSDKIKGENEKE